LPEQTFYNLPEEKRETILDAAIEEFAERGYQAASISKMVVAAGIAKGSFYQYFADKEDLYRYLLEEASRRQAQFMQDQQPPDPAMGPFAYLRWLLKVGLQFDFMNPRIMKVAQQAFDGAGPLPESVRRETRERGMVFLRQLLAQGVESGHIRPDVDLKAAAFVLFTVTRNLNAHVMQTLDIDPDEPDPAQRLREREAEVDAVFERVLSVLRDGVT
jgi:AcrR family transcriptional regulator